MVSLLMPPRVLIIGVLRVFFLVTFVSLIFPAAAIAQLGERQTEDLKVPGSIPGLGRAMHCIGRPRTRHLLASWERVPVIVHTGALHVAPW